MPEPTEYAKTVASFLIQSSGLAVLDKEPNSPFDADAFTLAYNQPVKPSPAPIMPLMPVEAPETVKRCLWRGGWLNYRPLINLALGGGLVIVIAVIAVSICRAMRWQ